MKRLNLIFILLIIVIFSFLSTFLVINYKKKDSDFIHINLPVMGTILEIKLYGKDKEKLNDAINSAADEIRRIEERFSIFTGDSEATKINLAAYKEPFKCSDEMWGIIKECQKYYQISEGAFDITIRPMMLLWGFYKKKQKLPSENEINDTLRKIGFHRIILEDKNKTILFTSEGMSLDFGGIVKGYAVDRAIAKIAEKRISSGFVNLGGNIRTLKNPPPGKDYYAMGIRDPLDKKNICGIAKFTGSKSLATSGNYERYVILENKHITHIINPLDGRPVENMLSVTVLAPDAITADALSTSIFIKGTKLAEKIHKENPDIEFLIFRRDNSGKIILEKFGNSWELN